MQEKYIRNIRKKGSELGSLARTVDAVTKSYKQNFNEEVIFLTNEEINRLEDIGNSSSISSDFSSASNNEKITKQVKNVLHELIDGKYNDVGKAKQRLDELKQEDKQSIKVVHPETIAAGILTLVSILPFILIPVLAPPLLPLLIFFVPVSITLFGTTLFFLKNNIDQAKENMKRTWAEESDSEACILSRLNQNDIQLLKKVNSQEWKNNFTAATDRLKQKLALRKINSDNNETFSSCKPCPSTQEEVKDNEKNENEEQELFNPSPFKMKPW